MKKALPLFLLAAAALFAFGCTSTPIKTTFDLDRPDGLGLSYASEKDVLYEKTITLEDGTHETTKFQAIASAAALAQAERDKVQAEANARNAAALVEALKLVPISK